jgi:hypothetical protein
MDEPNGHLHDHSLKLIIERDATNDHIVEHVGNGTVECKLRDAL